ncbi:MAG: hypothetical protein F4065_02060 [Rhodothermaceae bacterium]|nr:hypothetical protein [Rhodothermaceae bacterium]MXZ57394.1 hypothetical protein [Rhodothermaceae bacterium]MYB90567.1 hypothetical protein [Rhodothermaceae bacterium]MYD68315.1 hypothetical protein [Rhodothermaceae bacterium]MYG44304.1 hypothetical protein [Rhodothermaceae bacterium]
MILLKNLLLILHVLTAAAWFGLSLRLGSQAKFAVAGHPAVAVDGSRTISLMGIMIFLTFVFSMSLLMVGGGYPGQIQYHIASGLIVLLLGIQYLLLRPLWNSLRTAVESDSDSEVSEQSKKQVASRARSIAMTAGVCHLLWFTILILMFWNRF